MIERTVRLAVAQCEACALKRSGIL